MIGALLVGLTVGTLMGWVACDVLMVQVLQRENRRLAEAAGWWRRKADQRDLRRPW